MAYKPVFTNHEEEASTKDLVIEILSEHFPMSIKRIYNSIKKSYGKSVTYHAVYKAVNELRGSNVVVKHKLEYMLNRDYVDRLASFAERLKLNYKNDRGLIKELAENEFMLKRLNSQYEMAYFVLDILKNTKRGEIIAIAWPTAWPPLTTPPDLYATLQSIGKRAEAYCVCGGDGFLDKAFAKRWRRIGLRVKLGIKLDRMFETFVFRDMVIMIYQPPERRMQKYRYINLIKGLTSFDQDKFFLQIIKRESEIYAFVIKNAILADRIRQEIMSYF